jgi:hypothetical protein
MFGIQSQNGSYIQDGMFGKQSKTMDIKAIVGGA